MPEEAPALRILEAFRRLGEHLAVVVDEYGGTAGLVTTQDVLEVIVDDLPEAGEADERAPVPRGDGSCLLDGALPLDRLEEVLALTSEPGEAAAGFQTLGGLVLAQLGQIPAPVVAAPVARAERR